MKLTEQQQAELARQAERSMLRRLRPVSCRPRRRATTEGCDRDIRTGRIRSFSEHQR